MTLENKRECIENETLGIICAEQMEIDTLRKDITDEKTVEYASRSFIAGTLYNKQVVLVLSRPGKVAASITSTLLIQQFHVDFILFVGVAGALASSTVKIGDIVISNELAQHDVDARPWRKRFELPEIGVTFFESAKSDICKEAVEEYLNSERFTADFKGHDLTTKFGITTPSVHTGLVVSGDQFISDKDVKLGIFNAFKELEKTALACEMEGAAVAQVAYEFGVPALVVRIISDGADDDALEDFGAFLTTCSSPVIGAVVREFFAKL